MKYVFITGGVVSSIGKGITAAALGKLLHSSEDIKPICSNWIYTTMRSRHAAEPAACMGKALLPTTVRQRI